MESQAVKRRLAAIVSVDVVGYSRLMEADEAGTLAALKAARGLTDPRIEAFGGRIVGTAGDSLLVEFSSVSDAVSCALDVQTVMAERNQGLAEDQRMEFRIGVNLGDVMIEGDDIFGTGVNVAARLQALADPGGICLSQPVYDQVRHSLDLAYEDMGPQEVKNIAEPVRAYRVVLGGDETTASAVAAAAALPDIPAIAVLPFDNMSGDPEQEYFSDGITEDIITELSRLPHLFVCARNSSFTYKGRAVKARQIATELGVQYVLEGSVRKAGNRVRINAQLIDAVEDRHLWAERYDRELEDIFAVQDEITQNITGALGVKLIDTAQERALRKRPENLDAWDCVLRSWAHLMRFTREGNAESRAMAQRAVELDSDYSHGHVMLAWADFMDGVFGWSENPPEAFQRAFQSARKAVEFDQTLYAAHMILGVVLAFSGQLDRALEALERSLELNPNNADTHTHKAMGLIAAGRVDEGLAAIETAMRLNPHYPGWYFMPVAHAHFVRRQYREAIAPLTRLLDGNPEFVAAQALRAACHAQLDEAEAARADVDELLRLNPDHSVALVARANNFQDEEVKTRLLDALRKAGLPE